MSVGSLLNKTCTIRRSTPTTSSATGGPVQSWADASTSVPCAVQTVRQSERDIGARQTGIAEYNVYMASGTTVKTGDLLTTITDMSGVVLEVTSPGVDGVGRGTYTKCTAIHKVGYKVAG